jgi:hypothetical protein
MARYLVTYHGSGMPADPAQMEQAKAAFGQWVGEVGHALVDPGAPVHMVGQISSGTAMDAVEIGGYSILDAESVESARALLQSHPYVARGGTLQINEIIQV